MTVTVILGLSLLVQLAATVLAFRLNFAHGKRWAWTLISIALFLMTIRRAFTFSSVLNETVLSGAEEWEGPLVTVLSASASLFASSVMFAGIALIDPLFRQIARAEEVLRGTNIRLEEVVRHTEAELRVAQAIQRELLPEAAPEIPGFDLGGDTSPAGFAGGDYFDYIATPNGRLALVIADVSGHGVGPALHMAQVRAFLHALTLTMNDPGEILTSVNRLFVGEVPSGRFVTLFLASVDLQSRSLVYASAGHPGYLLRTSGASEQLHCTGPPIGSLKDLTYPTSPEILLHAGDTFLLITDGITEARLPDGTLFGIDRTLDSVRAKQHEFARQIVESLFHEVRTSVGKTPEHDDMSVLVMKVLGPDARVV